MLHFAKDFNDMRILGIALMILGLVGLMWGGFDYTSRDKIVDAGPLHASLDKRHEVSVPPAAGAALLIGGVAMLASRKRNF